jgi:hypothetical protein
VLSVLWWWARCCPVSKEFWMVEPRARSSNQLSPKQVRVSYVTASQLEVPCAL